MYNLIFTRMCDFVSATNCDIRYHQPVLGPAWSRPTDQNIWLVLFSWNLKTWCQIQAVSLHLLGIRLCQIST